jgi:hypothetical protein
MNLMRILGRLYNNIHLTNLYYPISICKNQVKTLLFLDDRSSQFINLQRFVGSKSTEYSHQLFTNLQTFLNKFLGAVLKKLALNSISKMLRSIDMAKINSIRNFSKYDIKVTRLAIAFV